MALLALLAGCSSTVDGTAATGTTPITDGTTVTTTPETSATEPSSTLEPPPTAIDEDADQQYCDGTITGAFGKEMQVAVVNTPNGRIDCAGAAAVLVGYYAQRPDPDPGSEPVVVAGFACNQVPHPDLPQVICGDGASLLYSMWRQGG